MNRSDDDLRRQFVDVARERLRRLNEGVIALEQGERAEPLVAEVMREIHTLKGESRMLGLAAVSRVAHRTEDVLLALKREGAFGDPARIAVVFDGLDLLSRLVEARVGGEASPEADAFAAKVEGVLGVPAPAPAAPAGAPAPPAAPPAPAPEPAAAGPDRALAYRVRGTTVEEITRTSGVIGLLQARVRQAVEEVARLHAEIRPEALARAPEAGAAPSPAAPERLAGRLDAAEDVLESLQEACFALSLRHQRLMDAVASLRLTEAGTLLGRFPRTVRDLSRELGKEAVAVVEGEHVGADQQVLEALADPVLHLVRNAIDHGLEPPDLRAAAGKPRRGTITLSAHQAGRFVEIRVADDGRGIDPRTIAEVAVRRGLLSEADAARMSEDELRMQLFRPSFSTRSAVSDVSGRGVGLDVVKTVTEALGGSVRIQSEVGRGSTFVLRVPVSVALVDALVVDLGHGTCAFPSTAVVRVLETEGTTFETVGDRRSVLLPDGRRAPVFDLAEVLGYPPGPAGAPTRLVVVEHLRTVAFLVPRLVGEMSLVQEATDPFLRNLRIVSGTAMLEGGRHVVVLNVGQLLEALRAPPAAAAAAPGAGAEAAARRRVLLVEDSDLTRDMVARLLAEHGLEVAEAVNGSEGLARFADAPADLVVTDLEMPVMTGLEMIRRLRATPEGARVPVVVFTTVADAASKSAAAEAGADAYFVKASFAPPVFLETLDRLLARPEPGAAA